MAISREGGNYKLLRCYTVCGGLVPAVMLVCSAHALPPGYRTCRVLGQPFVEKERKVEENAD